MIKPPRARFVRLALVAVAAGVLAFSLGPRNTVEADALPLPFTAVPADPATMPGHLARLEAQHPGIVPGTEKSVRFGPAGMRRAPWAVVYLHGFSATRQEIAPLPEHVADALGANLFATRLTGHGRDGAAMAEGSVAAWKSDALEALAIGRVLGERGVVIGVSTGASLAVWLAQQPEARERVAWVLLSPNFGTVDPASEIINWPWGRTIARWVVGAEHRFEPRNAEQARYWTTRYPVDALFPLLATVHLAREQPLEAWRAPVLMLFSPRDQITDPEAAQRAFARIGAERKRLVAVHDADDPKQHVLAGHIMSPGTTEAVATTIVDWLRSLPETF